MSARNAYFQHDPTNIQQNAHEYMHISNPTERKWFRDRVEKTDDFKFTQNGKEAILNKLIQAEGFEKFLHTKYVGTKRFGLDGGESLFPGLEEII